MDVILDGDGEGEGRRLGCFESRALWLTGERRYMAGTGFPGKEERSFERHI